MGMPWDGASINCYVIGQTNMSHGQSFASPSFTMARKAIFIAYAGQIHPPPHYTICFALVTTL